MAVNVEAAKEGEGEDKVLSLRVQQAFRELRRGDRPLAAFLKEVERAFASCSTDVAALRLAFEHEAVQYTLPDEVLSEISRRLDAAVAEYHLRGGPVLAEGVDLTEESGEADVVSDGDRDHTPVANSRGESNGKRTILNERYVLIECVGVGGSSTVFKALDRRRLLFEDPFPFVAVKILNDKLRSRADWLEVLKQEAVKCHQLKHPNIIRVYDFLRDGQRVYITMEFLSGSPLTQIVRSRDFNGMPAREALHIVDKMASALQFAHERGIVHRDFKPANIFRTDDGEVKLIDFGIAQIFSQSAATAGEQRTETKQEPQPRHAVTPAYASPELLERREPDPRDDVYSLACTTYELLTGAHPFGYKSALDARTAGLSVPAARALTANQLAAIRHALDFDRERRTPSVTQFVAELHAVPRVGNERLLLSATAAVFIAGLTWLYFYHKNSVDVEVVADSSELIAESEFADIATETEAAKPNVTIAPSSTDTHPGTGEVAPTASPAATVAVDNTAPAGQEDFQAPVPVQKSTPDAATATAKLAQDPGPTKRQQLDERGYVQLAQGKLTAPPGDNALASFQAALKLDRKDPMAWRGLQQIADHFQSLALAKRKDQDYLGSLALIKQGLRVTRDHPGLLKLRKEIEEVAAANAPVKAARQPAAPTQTEPVVAANTLNAPPPSEAIESSPPPSQPTGRPRIRIFGGF